MPSRRPWTETLGRLLRSLTSSGDPAPHRVWPTGCFPTADEVYIVGDGLGSASRRLGLRPRTGHLVYPFGQQIGKSTQLARVGGLSYFAEGLNYYAADTTNVPIIGMPTHRFEGYAPRPINHLIYLGFSLGGTVLTLNMEQWLNSVRGMPATTRIELWLLQPGFALSTDAVQACTVRSGNTRAPRPLPAAIEDFLKSPADVTDTILSALRSIRGAEVPVRLLYWPGDGFVAYPRELMTALREIGVTIDPLPLDFSSRDLDPFQEHVAVPRERIVYHRLQELAKNHG